MSAAQLPRTRRLTVVAQDPTVKNIEGEILTTQVVVPAEELQPGPVGYRVQVIDYDSSQDVYYAPPEIGAEDPFEKKPSRELIANPQFHAQNVYALVMRTLARFEFALGRRISWGFYGHHLKISPHAFSDANAFYSPDDHALFFGYFPDLSGKRTVFTCLSHDVVVHETTHALLDGLRTRYTDPSSPDQAAFHEGFADIVALLSVFSLRDIVAVVIDRTYGKRSSSIRKEAVGKEELRKSILFGLAEQMGREIQGIRGDALRRSVELKPSSSYYLKDEEFIEPHRRGEILVAAFMNGFLEVWARRLAGLGEIAPGFISRDRVVEEGAEIADQLLTTAIRALDYSPAIHIEFGDFLSALITGHSEVDPDDRKYSLRDMLRKSFLAYGIEPTSKLANQGHWTSAPENLHYDRSHCESMRSDPDEVFRFVWENRKALETSEDAYSRVISVRPCVRIAPDGFALREVVAEFLQTLNLNASELGLYGIAKPEGMPDAQAITLHGGAALIFDEYGRLKYSIHNRVLNAERQSKRLDYLWRHGAFRKGALSRCNFSQIHRRRAVGLSPAHGEEW